MRAEREKVSLRVNEGQRAKTNLAALHFTNPLLDGVGDGEAVCNVGDVNEESPSN